MHFPFPCVLLLVTREQISTSASAVLLGEVRDYEEATFQPSLLQVEQNK